MNNSIQAELTDHVIDTINDCFDDETTDFSELHFHAFNEDYYVAGSYNAKQWLKKHAIDSFDAVAVVRAYEEDNFGDFTTEIRAENIVNMYVYIMGEEIISGIDLDSTKTELINTIEGE